MVNGKSEIIRRILIMKSLPKIALGAWAWGNDGTFGGSLTAETLRPIFDKAMENGLNLWDTAYAYGMGTSEKVLAGFVKGLPRDSYIISDKFTPQCADGSSPTAMKDMIEMQLGLMELDRFDIYWIHNVWDAPKWTEELAKYFEGKDHAPMIGVSNHDLAEIKQAAEILKAQSDIDIHCTDVEYADYGVLVPVMSAEHNGANDELEKEELILAKAIVAFAEDESLRKHYSEKALERARFFSPESVIAQWEKFVQE